MKHLYNKLSGRNLCEVKHPKLNHNVSDRGQVLGADEKMCPTCSQWWLDYIGYRKTTKE